MWAEVVTLTLDKTGFRMKWSPEKDKHFFLSHERVDPSICHNNYKNTYYLRAKNQRDETKTDSIKER